MPSTFSTVGIAAAGFMLSVILQPCFTMVREKSRSYKSYAGEYEYLLVYLLLYLFYLWDISTNIKLCRAGFKGDCAAKPRRTQPRRTQFSSKAQGHIIWMGGITFDGNQPVKGQRRRITSGAWRENGTRRKNALKCLLDCNKYESQQQYLFSLLYKTYHMCQRRVDLKNIDISHVKLKVALHLLPFLCFVQFV